MIRLIDLILENPADDAKRMGLVSKPGFGLYGPPDDSAPATHRSMMGKLVPIAQSTTQQKQGTTSTTQQSPDKPTNTQPKVGQQKSVARSSSPIGRTRVYEVTGLSDMISGVSSTFGSDGKITNLSQTLNAVAKPFGRDTAPPTQIGGDILDSIVQFEGAGTTMGIYNVEADSIQISPDMKEFIDTPVSEWDTDQILAFKTYTHETIHSTSPRLKPGNTEVVSDPILLTIEEGLTEYIAQGISLGAIEPHNSKAQDVNSGEGYRGYVDGIEFMTQHGELDASSTFRNPSTRQVANIVRNAQALAINSTLNSIQADKDIADKIYYKAQNMWQENGIIALTDEKFVRVMQFFRQEAEANRPVPREKIEELLEDYLS